MFDLLLREPSFLDVTENDQANTAIDDAGKIGLGRHICTQCLMAAKFPEDPFDHWLGGT